MVIRIFPGIQGILHLKYFFIICCRSWILESGLVESELLNGKFPVGLRDFRPSAYRAAESANFKWLRLRLRSEIIAPTPTPTALQLWLKRMYSILIFALVGESFWPHQLFSRLFIHQFCTLPKNFRSKSSQVRSPGQVKWPLLKKYLGDRRDYSFWGISMKLSVVDKGIDT